MQYPSRPTPCRGAASSVAAHLLPQTSAAGVLAQGVDHDERCAAAEILLAITDLSNCLKCHLPIRQHPHPGHHSTLKTEIEPRNQSQNLAITEHSNCLKYHLPLRRHLHHSRHSTLTTNFEPADRAQIFIDETNLVTTQSPRQHDITSFPKEIGATISDETKSQSSNTTLKVHIKQDLTQPNSMVGSGLVDA